jgi:uncharacterized tellurite resistance protein B-like protein
VLIVLLPLSVVVTTVAVPVALLAFAWFHPSSGIPTLIVFSAVAYWFITQRPALARRASIARQDSGRLQPRKGSAEALLEIGRRDPGFSAPNFLNRTRKVFRDVQEAWFRRRLEEARHLMSDGLHRRFATLQALMRAEGRRDAVTDVQVIASDIVDAGTTGAFEFVTVRIDAALRDTEVTADTSDDAARAAAAATPLENFTELWTFVRRPSATTRSGYDLGLGACPSCGAPFEGGASGSCRYCKAIVNSGAYDWVLSEITQASEYLPHARRAPGLDELRERDPDLGSELLEDRALLVFWKWIEAQCTGRAAGLRKLSSDAGWSRIEEDSRSGRWSTWRLPAVGGADLAALEPDLGGLDRAHVDIRWSGAKAGAAPRPHRHVVTLVRAATARTDQGAGLASERCGQCRAPLTDSDAASCEYCGHEFGAASHEWQLEAVTPYESWRRPTSEKVRRQQAVADNAAAAFATESERVRLLQLMAAVAKADGFVDRQEIKLLRGTAQRWRVDWRVVQPVLDGAGDGDLDAAPDPEALLRSLVLVARSDGRIDPRELALIQKVAAHLKQDAAMVDRLLAA